MRHFMRDAFAVKLAGVMALVLSGLSPLVSVHADDGGVSDPARGIVHRFQRQPLTRTYFSEGTAVGDLNADGHMDVVYGPHWYSGPDFKQAREIYPAKPQPMSGYADHFFAWVQDFNADGWNDVLAVGFPGRLTISVRPRVPAVCLERIAVGTDCSETARINSPKPGRSLSQTAVVASGVTSRGAGPVPPVVTIRSQRS